MDQSDTIFSYLLVLRQETENDVEMQTKPWFNLNEHCLNFFISFHYFSFFVSNQYYLLTMSSFSVSHLFKIPILLTNIVQSRPNLFRHFLINPSQIWWFFNFFVEKEKIDIFCEGPDKENETPSILHW